MDFPVWYCYLATGCRGLKAFFGVKIGLSVPGELGIRVFSPVPRSKTG